MVVPLFGVVMGFIGNLGIYKSVKKIGNRYIAAMAVMFSSCIYQLVYYWQECAEYCLMLGTLCWTIYLFFSVIEEQTTKNIILFTISAILPVYSQYGAVFPVLIMLFAAYIFVFIKKEKKGIIIISFSYIVAFVVAAIPLFFFFIKKQIENQQGGEIQAKTLSFEGNIVKDFLSSFKIVVKWNLFSYYGDQFTVIFIIVAIIAIIVMFILSKNKYIKILGIVNVVTWILYYFAVKIGIYSYGDFGGRYSIFFLPLWIVTIFCFIIDGYEMLKVRCSGKFNCLKYYYAGICLCMVFCFIYLGWTLKIQNNWSKENMRDAVKKWISEGAVDSNTIVYYAGDSGFAYYLRQYDGYTEKLEDNVNYMYWYRDRSVEEYTEYVNSIYGEDWPDEIYIIGIHTRDDFDTLVNVFTDRGWQRTDLYDSGGFLVRLNYLDRVYRADQLYYTEDVTNNFSQGIVMKSGCKQYGPYVNLKKGIYQICVVGKQLQNGEVRCTYNSGKNNLEILNLKKEENCITYYIELTEDCNDVEFILFSNRSEDIILDYLMLGR